MSSNGNTFGKSFSVTTFGESHGTALGCVIDGCPAGIELTKEMIQKALDRRRPGASVTGQASASVTARKEADAVEILSGVFNDLTTGTPIALEVRNTSQHSGDYGNLDLTSALRIANRELAAENIQTGQSDRDSSQSRTMPR